MNLSKQWKNLGRGNEEAESSEQKTGDWVPDMAYIA